MRLVEILNNVSNVQVKGLPDQIDISKLSIDSREADADTLFFAIKGFKVDGHNFIPEVISKGTKAIVADKNSSLPDDLFRINECALILVDDTRKSLAEISNIFYDRPSRRLKLIGITGTKGKTTTAYLIKNILDNAGFNSGLIGTVENIIGEEKITSRLTTPESHEINYYLSEMVNKGIEFCVMEVSSHSLALHRVDYLDFDFAVFTNLTSDHMDFHESKEHYLKSKKILFDNLRKDAFAVFNADDENCSELLKDSKAHLVSYGANGKCDFNISDSTYDFEGSQFVLSSGNKSKKIRTSLIGEFNIYNAAAAASVGSILGLNQDQITGGIANLKSIKGRFEVIPGFEKKVIIDFSHTADSLKEALLAVNEINNKLSQKKEIITVFGCGGNRDKTKRPLMGKYATDLSDYVFITSDNPRDEEPMSIINDILNGVEKNNYQVLEDREEAIKTAIINSKQDSIILISGKGHETYQIVKGVKSHFSDRETAEKYLKQCQN
ncbi:MAG: UDP-N-acetylmuramoyl-L-alanyl-D-glutamate--2,6-diaminopimelate ligase [Melioribacteraceae bacterium]|nr:UDP-N-acetylmuramoyl-L-alanyl-D-glutamate--2,6-diaminopimelate ligase [Melioribacteraceae bacterium]